MNKIIPFLIMVLVFLVGTVSAFNYSSVDGFEIPKEISGIIGKQNVNVFVDEEFLFSVSIKDKKVFSGDSLLDKATLEIYISSETISRIEESEDKVSEILDAYKSQEIKMVKKTLMNKLKFFFAKFFI